MREILRRWRASFYASDTLTAEIEFRAADIEAAQSQALTYPAQDGADTVVLEAVSAPVVRLRDRARALMLAALAGQWLLLAASCLVLKK